MKCQRHVYLLYVRIGGVHPQLEGVYGDRQAAATARQRRLATATFVLLWPKDIYIRRTVVRY